MSKSNSPRRKWNQVYKKLRAKGIPVERARARADNLTGLQYGRIAEMQERAATEMIAQRESAAANV